MRTCTVYLECDGDLTGWLSLVWEWQMHRWCLQEL